MKLRPFGLRQLEYYWLEFMHGGGQLRSCYIKFDELRGTLTMRRGFADWRP